MKIVNVNTNDIHGGAARAAYRLHKSLLASAVDSIIFVQSKNSDDFTIIGPKTFPQKISSKLSPFVDSLPVRFYQSRSKTLFSTAFMPSSYVVQKINALKPDIVHLHWINAGFLKIEDIVKIKAPVVWSLHDMWAFTGGCHYDEGCGGFVQSCGKCKVLGSDKPFDLSSRIYNRKRKSFSKFDIQFIALSNWLFNEAKKSSLLKDKIIHQIPNSIDTIKFAPFDKNQARKLLNLPSNKKLILFGAVSSTSDPRKGFIELTEALKLINTDNAELVVFGASRPEKENEFKLTTHFLGHLHDDVSLRILYSAADVMVVPSLQENLSNAIMESLACGTPVVGFDIGGNPDMIEHMLNGYLARAYDIKDLAYGISWVIEHPEPFVLKKMAREKVLDKFDSSVVAQQYISIYKKLIR